MSIKVNITPRLENGDYRVEMIDDKGFVSNKIDIKPTELPELFSEICEDEDGLLDTLRKCYQLFEPVSIEFKEKENDK